MQSKEVKLRKSEFPFRDEYDVNLNEKKRENKKVLYVEDDLFTRLIMDKYLSKLYHLDLAENSEVALKRIHTTIYDVILMDINLGKGINGLELTQVIRNIQPYKRVPIIAVSAFAHANNKKEILARGITDCISKPFKLKDILSLLDKIFEAKKNA